MLHAWSALLTLLISLPAVAQETTRYGVARDEKAYSQASPRDALASVLSAVDAGKFDYLVANLADPAFVDDRVKRVYGGKFEEQVQDTRSRMDPATVKQLRRFQKEGKWTIDKESAEVSLEDVKDRVVRLAQREGRWYLLHRFEPNGR